MIPIESQAQIQKATSGKEDIADQMTLKFKPNFPVCGNGYIILEI